MSKDKYRLPIEMEEWVYDTLMKDYKELNDEPSYTFDQYLSEILNEEAQHISKKGDRRSAFYCWCDAEPQHTRRNKKA